MKKIFILTLLSLFFIITSCSKITSEEVEIVKDCTGSYLKFNNKDYHICNEEIVNGFNNGDIVEASFRRIDECNNTGAICMMAHKNEGWIKVTKIE